MKKLVILTLGLILGGGVMAQQDPTILTINNNPVTKSEFKQIYLKNNKDPKYDKASLDEYMELFKKFKLKVAEAEAQGYDTIPALVSELAGYKKQLARPYLVDSAKNDELVLEAYNRLKSEIKASHILIRVDEKASPADTLKAYNKIMRLKERVLKGEKFSAVAKGKGGSEDPSAVQNGGDLGYFTAFQMVYPFEEAAYNTPVGSISNPVRTRFGYHIIEVNDKRDARGTISTAHIMVMPESKSKSDLIKAVEKIKEIYAKLQAGEDWDLLAQQYSDDVNSKDKGGRLPEFGSGTSQRMVPEFEDEAFKLKKDGEYSAPFETQYGYHIIKRLAWKPLASLNEMKKELQNKVNKDARGEKTQSSFVNKLKKSYGFEYVNKDYYSIIKKDLDSTIFQKTWKYNGSYGDKVIFKYAGKNYTIKDFTDFLEVVQRKQKAKDMKLHITNLYKSWEKNALIGYEESQLENKYPAYKALMQEYHDGVLLYEIMKDEIWDKAVKDTNGLNAYYDAHKNMYMHPDRIDATVYELYDKKIAKKVYKMVKKGADPKMVQEKYGKGSQLNIRANSGLFNPKKDERIKDKKLKIGTNKPYSRNEKFYVVKVQKEVPSLPKTLKEAKGSVIQDYQNELEKNWLEALAKKHPIQVKTEVLYSLGE